VFLHTRLKVSDLERSIAFYTEFFGMTCRFRNTSPRGSQLAFMSSPGCATELELACLPWDARKPREHVSEDMFHLAFRVENMTETIQKMRAAGIPITEEPSSRRNGGEMAFIEDPDGYEIELLSFAPHQPDNLLNPAAAAV